MARVIPGPLISDIRGSVATDTYARNRGGLYVRNRTAPTQPSSARQSYNHNLMILAVAKWQDTLTDEQRLGWHTLAASSTNRNQFLGPHPISGYSLFIRAFLNARTVGATDPSSAPANLHAIPIKELYAETNSVSGSTLILNVGQLGDGTQGIVASATPQFSAGRTFPPPTWYRLFGAGWSNFHYQMYTLWTAHYGAATVGQKVAWKVHTVDKTSLANTRAIILLTTWAT